MPHVVSMAEPKPIRPSDIQWKPYAALPAGAENSVLIGELSAPGPLVFRVRLPPGLRIMPHWHPEDRVYTVISGLFRIGFCSSFDEKSLQVMGPGSVISVPARQNHFHFSGQEGYEAQINSTGPTATTYSNPADDPRKSLSK